MADEDKKDEKKIIADEDWKDQARKEKEVLTEQEKLEHEEPQEEPKRPESLPKGDFAGLISMLVTQALFALGVLDSIIASGLMPDRRRHRRYPRHVKVKMSSFKRNSGRPAPSTGEEGS